MDAERLLEKKGCSCQCGSSDKMAVETFLKSVDFSCQNRILNRIRKIIMMHSVTHIMYTPHDYCYDDDAPRSVLKIKTFFNTVYFTRRGEYSLGGNY